MQTHFTPEQLQVMTSNPPQVGNFWPNGLFEFIYLPTAEGKVVGAMALTLFDLPAALLFALAGPHRPEYHVERVGQSAEIVLLLDRSRSMDQGFAPGRALPAGISPKSPQALDHYFSQAPARLRESKGLVARRLLAEFGAIYRVPRLQFHT